VVIDANTKGQLDRFRHLGISTIGLQYTNVTHKSSGLQSVKKHRHYYYDLTPVAIAIPLYNSKFDRKWRSIPQFTVQTTSYCCSVQYPMRPSYCFVSPQQSYRKYSVNSTVRINCRSRRTHPFHGVVWIRTNPRLYRQSLSNGKVVNILLPTPETSDAWVR